MAITASRAFVNDLSIYRSARRKMRTGDMLQWRGNYSFSKLIRKVTGENENHTSMVIRLEQFPGRVFSIEALEHGLHLWPLSHLLKKYDGSVNWYPIRDEYYVNNMEGPSADAARWLLAHLGTPYDWADCASNWRTLIGFNPDPADERQLYCSESVFLSFKEKKLDDMSELYIGAGLKHIQHIEISPWPGRPMVDLGIWRAHAAVAILIEEMRRSFSSRNVAFAS